MRTWGVWRGALAVTLLALPGAALAGAWTLGAGEGAVFATVTATQATRAFDANRKLQSIPRYDKDEPQALFELGATDWFTAMLTPSLQHVGIGAPIDAHRTGLGYSEFGGRARLLQGDAWVVSAQTTFRLPGTFDKSNIAAIGYTDPEVDIRALFGYSFNQGAWPAFVDIQVAQRFRFGDPPDEFRADATFGIRPLERWLLLAQSFNVISEGAGVGVFPSYTYSKFQLSAVYALTPTVSLQLGGTTTYRGYNALQENGVIVGAWFKF